MLRRWASSSFAAEATKPRKHFRLAHDLARNAMERQFFDRRLGTCERGDLEQAYCELFWGRMLDSPASAGQCG
jgi:hypothetical protein